MELLQQSGCYGPARSPSGVRTSIAQLVQQVAIRCHFCSYYATYCSSHLGNLLLCCISCAVDLSLCEHILTLCRWFKSRHLSWQLESWCEIGLGLSKCGKAWDWNTMRSRASICLSGWNIGDWLADCPWFVPVPWLTCDHFVGKFSTVGQPTMQTQPAIPPESMSSNTCNCVVGDHQMADRLHMAVWLQAKVRGHGLGPWPKGCLPALCVTQKCCWSCSVWLWYYIMLNVIDFALQSIGNSSGGCETQPKLDCLHFNLKMLLLVRESNFFMKKCHNHIAELANFQMYSYMHMHDHRQKCYTMNI